jgi:predicted metallopeptidase
LRYSYSEDFTGKARGLCDRLGFTHVEPERVSVIISRGSKSRRVIARIHTLSKALQLGMEEKPFYVIELISERFMRMEAEEQTKTLIHELLHIPQSFSGGFRHHRPYVNSRTVEEHYRKLC